ncbi:hypothetical protein NDU88_000053 [Pleurodeles waltl]|uniref:Uncharacterized protein n=1 Tax=Pleurodeles waltl TaxID=8319 RepID=A0AAV7TF71_PLEWA|nr:hypothetical protein NDU88_000053 [Pleurodeles waltl]
MKTQIAPVATDVNLLRTDLRVVAEHSVATEKRVTCLQSKMDMLKASVAILEAKTDKPEARVEDAEGRGRGGLEWEALKVVISGESHSKTYGIRQSLDRELTHQEVVLAALQCQVDNGDASDADCLEVKGRIVDLWDRLENYVRRNYRQ